MVDIVIMDDGVVLMTIQFLTNPILTVSTPHSQSFIFFHLAEVCVLPTMMPMPKSLQIQLYPVSLSLSSPTTQNSR